jgi:hypothetical protein
LLQPNKDDTTIILYRTAMPARKDDLPCIVGRYIRDVAPDALPAYLDQTGLTEQ